MREYPTIELEGMKYVTERTAASLLNKSVKVISKYVVKGNAFGILPSRDIAGRILIAVEDLHRYPFTKRGPHSRLRVYHYDADFHQVRCDACSKGEKCELNAAS